MTYFFVGLAVPLLIVLAIAAFVVVALARRSRGADGSPGAGGARIALFVGGAVVLLIGLGGLAFVVLARGSSNWSPTPPGFNQLTFLAQSEVADAESLRDRFEGAVERCMRDGVQTEQRGWQTQKPQGLLDATARAKVSLTFDSDDPAVLSDAIDMDALLAELELLLADAIPAEATEQNTTVVLGYRSSDNAVLRCARLTFEDGTPRLAEVPFPEAFGLDATQTLAEPGVVHPVDTGP